MLVFLRPFLVGDGHTLTSQLTSAHLADAGNYVGDGVIRILAYELGAVVALAGGPSLHHISQVPDQDVGRDGEVSAATVGVGVVGVVFYRTVTWAVG